jgi:hypothetical protein
MNKSIVGWSFLGLGLSLGVTLGGCSSEEPAQSKDANLTGDRAGTAETPKQKDGTPPATPGAGSAPPSPAKPADSKDKATPGDSTANTCYDSCIGRSPKLGKPWADATKCFDTCSEKDEACGDRCSAPVNAVCDADPQACDVFLTCGEECDVLDKAEKANGD